MSLPSLNGSPSGVVGVLIADYLRVLYHRRWLALSVFLAVVLAVAVYTYRTVSLYQAQVSILIDVDEPNVVGFRQVLDEGRLFGAYQQTQQELLLSRALVQRTVRALELWKRPGFGPSTEDGAVGAVRGALQVAPIRGTRMVHLRFRWRDPEVAAEIANAHAKQYIEQSLEKRFLASQEATKWLDGQLADERKRVEASQSALQRYREQHDALSLQDGQNIVVQKLADLNAAVTRAKTTRIERETQYRELLDAQRDPAALDAFPAILSNGFIQQVKGDLVTLQRDYAKLSETLGDRHPTMVETRTAMETTEKRLAAEIARLVESMRTAYQAALTEERSLTRALDEQKLEATALNRRGIEYAALQREAESVRLVYQSLLQRAKETSVSQELRATNVQIIDPARPNQQPVFPRTTFNMLMAILTGTLLAVGAAFLAELVDDRVKVPGDVSGRLGHVFLGLVPEVRSRKSKRLAPGDRDAPQTVVEAFRGLRTSVIAAMPAGPRSILVASAGQHEGKTHVASNLAIALAQAKHRVLLIDADLRRPSVHERLGQRPEPGLSNVLAGTATLNEALQKASAPGLTVLTAGNPTNQAPEQLGSTLFSELLAILQEHFDWVIIDSPPALTVTDASVIAPRTTGVLFVVGSAMTSSRTARLAHDELQRAGGRSLGTVLNRADVSHHPFYFAPYLSGDYLGSLKEPTGDPIPATSSSLLGGGA
jgi:succinoglycan biosynthesis transport protein ExoP